MSTATQPLDTAPAPADTPAFVFPGQGSQYAGMGRDLTWCESERAAVVGLAEEITGRPVHEWMTRADTATIADPAIAQLIVHVHSLVLLERLRVNGTDCAVTAGHSLGEYTAMVAAGMLTSADSLRIVAARGAAMAAAAQRTPGAMAAIVGLDVELVEALCAAAEAQPVVVANLNSPRQAVVSGTEDGVAEVSAAAAAAGALRARRLPVGGAYHSPLMAPARDELAPLLAAVAIAEPSRGFVSSTTGEPVADPEQQRTHLLGQITAPVRWRDTVARLAGRGVTRYLEVGPGRVLSGLGREMHRAAVHETVRPAPRIPMPMPKPAEVAR